MHILCPDLDVGRRYAITSNLKLKIDELVFSNTINRVCRGL